MGIEVTDSFMDTGKLASMFDFIMWNKYSLVEPIYETSDRTNQVKGLEDLPSTAKYAVLGFWLQKHEREQ